jgi:hypothetical protein
MFIGRLEGKKNNVNRSMVTVATLQYPTNLFVACLFSSLPTKPNPLHLLSRIGEKQEKTEGLRRGEGES